MFAAGWQALPVLFPPMVTVAQTAVRALLVPFVGKVSEYGRVAEKIWPELIEKDDEEVMMFPLEL
jgi:hypothetical protein